MKSLSAPSSAPPDPARKAFEETTKRGWTSDQAGRVREAAIRFNQAFLISPEQSTVYHGFAVIAQARFKDLDAADELFKIALKQPNPMKALNADYGRLLLIAKRPTRRASGAGRRRSRMP